MTFTEILARRRSIRRFQQIVVKDDELLQIIDAAAVAPSAGNRQPLKYVVIRSRSMLERIFNETRWGALVAPNRNPVFGESSPMAFIAVCTDPEADSVRWAETDAGAAIMSMELKAVELGFGTCWIGAFNRETVSDMLDLGEGVCLYLLAVGVPMEEPVLEEIGENGSRKYYLDDRDVIHVPKFKAKTLTRFE